MSSMRNAVQRRNHKERAQPHERERWGLLEKHKDYQLRAKDYNEKKKKLKALRQKAAERNPDEFHFAMMSHQFRDGHKTSKNSPYASMPHATAQLLKTQDAGYLRTMIQSTRKARQRLREELVLQQTQDRLMDEDEDADGESRTPLKQRDAPLRRHTVFVDDRAQQKMYDRRQRPSLDALPHHGHDGVDAETDGEEDGAAGGTSGPKRRISGRERAKNASLTEDDVEMRQKAMAARERKLKVTRERETALVAAEHELELQRAKMGNHIGGVTKAGHKFKIKQRKK